MIKVLYVDDEPAIRRAVREWLQRLDVDVHEADSVESAKALCHEHRFAGAILDVWLPDGTGFDLLSWIQANDRSLAGHVAFVTGDIAPRAEERARLTAVGRPVLVKPFDLREVERIVRGWTGGEGAAAESPPDGTG